MLSSPVINGTRIEAMCKDVLQCAIDARETHKCEDCNQSLVYILNFVKTFLTLLINTYKEIGFSVMVS